METLNTLVNDINALVWGVPMLVLILGTGLFLMIYLKFMPWLNIPAGFALLWKGATRTMRNPARSARFRR